jgi:hypothetical protein
MNAVIFRLHKKFPIECDPALWRGIEELKNLEEFVFVSEVQKGRCGPRAIVEEFLCYRGAQFSVSRLRIEPVLRS